MGEIGATDRYRRLGPFWEAVVAVLTAAGILLAVNQIFNLQFFVGFVLLENRYLYVLLGLFLGLAFIIFPAGSRWTERVPWYDAALFALALAVCGYFAWNGERMIREAWEFRAPPTAVALGIILWLLILEGARRTGGLAFAVVVLVLSLYPAYAGDLPGPIAGFSLSFEDTIRYQVASVEAILGIPMRVFGSFIIGFILFGLALQFTGGGRFFIDLAMALLGSVRGGTAKVAIAASGLFGMMSGSAVSNVLSTGVVTIPAMKRTGFRPADAAAIEANASSAGVITPPVMGATAFIMASVLGVPYVEVALAAAIPAFLFYLSLFCQIDAYAAKFGIKGLSRGELPRLGDTLKAGWRYLVAFFALIFMLVYLRQEALAPFYATLILLALAMLRPETRLTPPRLKAALVSAGRILAELVAVLAAVGLIIGALSVTGIAGTFSSDVLRLAGGNILTLLILGAIVCLILGTALTITPSYVFLAVVFAPALIKEGLHPMAVHLFILYWAMLSDITPPTALSVVVASNVAGASPFRAMMEAMRFGAVKYFLPFFFVYHPVLVGAISGLVDLLVALGGATLGVGLIAYAIQGYLPMAGTLRPDLVGMFVRGALVTCGLLLAFPEPITGIIGLGVGAVTYGLVLATARTGLFTAAPVKPAPASTSSQGLHPPENPGE